MGARRQRPRRVTAVRLNRGLVLVGLVVSIVSVVPAIALTGLFLLSLIDKTPE